MKHIALVVVALAIGCSTVDIDQKLNELGITRTESKNFFKAVVAIDAACKQSDSPSIQVCQFYSNQRKLIPDVPRFFKTSLSSPDSLSDEERSAFDNITLVGAAYREYVEAKQANADSERLWNSFVAGAAVGTLFSRPPPAQLNCYVYGSWAQCQ